MQFFQFHIYTHMTYYMVQRYLMNVVNHTRINFIDNQISGRCILTRIIVMENSIEFRCLINTEREGSI